MELVHEIALNPDFKLQPYEPPENRWIFHLIRKTTIHRCYLFHFSLEKRVKDTMHKAFWDVLREQLNKDPPCYDHAMQLLNDIKEVSYKIFKDDAYCFLGYK